MTKRIIVCVAINFALVLFVNRHAPADVLWLKGEESPRIGQVVRTQENGSLVFKIRHEDRSYSEQEFKSDEIATLVTNIDLTRLGLLNPNALIKYRDYAEELAQQKIDKQARDLAIRLYLIAAAGAQRQDNPKLVESALIGLTNLARNEQERQQFEMLLALHARNPGIAASAQPVIDSTTTNTRVNAQARQRLLQAVRLIRQEANDSAIEILQSPDVIQELQSLSTIITTEQIRLMTRTRRLSLTQLRKLLVLELALQNPSGEALPRNQKVGWAEQAQSPMGGWIQIPNFGNVTEFDPDKSVFRKGDWVKPLDDFPNSK